MQLPRDQPAGRPGARRVRFHAALAADRRGGLRRGRPNVAEIGEVAGARMRRGCGSRTAPAATPRAAFGGRSGRPPNPVVQHREPPRAIRRAPSGWPKARPEPHLGRRRAARSRAMRTAQGRADSSVRRVADCAFSSRRSSPGRTPWFVRDEPAAPRPRSPVRAHSRLRYGRLPGEFDR